ncbi:MAG: hypothetical protein ACYDHT_05375, partial [Solirubrobacteraceae bacterium]
MSTTQRQNSAETACAHDLAHVEQAFIGHGLSIPPHARARARELAYEALAGFDDPQEAAGAARMSCAVSLFQAHAADLAGDPDRVRALVGGLCPALGVSEQSLAHALLSCIGDAGRPPAETVRVLLGLLTSLAPVGGASLWRRDAAGA